MSKSRSNFRRPILRTLIGGFLGAMLVGGVLMSSPGGGTPMGIHVQEAEAATSCEKGCYREALRQKRWCRDYNDPRDKAQCYGDVRKDERACLDNCR